MSDDIGNEAQKDEVLNRLRRIEGQIRGIQRMVTEERTCEAIVTQLMAARAALDKASLHVMSHHIERCLLDPSGQASHAQLERIMSFFLKFAGPPSGVSEDALDAAGDDDR